MSWKSIYQSRVVSADEAIKAINSGNRLFLTGNVSVPKMILAALVRRAPLLKDVEICQALTVGPSDFVAPEMEGHLRINSMFISPNVRKAGQDGRADFTPVLLSEFPLFPPAPRSMLCLALIRVDLCTSVVEVRSLVSAKQRTGFRR